MDLGLPARLRLNRLVQKQPAAGFSLDCFYKDKIVLLCFCFLIKQFFSNYTNIIVFNIIAALFSLLAILIVGKISYYLKVRQAEYYAYCYLVIY